MSETVDAAVVISAITLLRPSAHQKEREGSKMEENIVPTHTKTERESSKMEEKIVPKHTKWER